MIRRGIGVQSFVSAGIPPDADATAFITAAGITDATQQSAINTLVIDLKGYGIWSKMKAIWPMVGGTASTHKWNLKDPRDLDAAFRLLFSGGITHSSTGVLWNGVNGFGRTYLLPSTLTANNAHLSYYSRTQNITGNQLEIGCSNSGSGIPEISQSFYYNSSNYKGFFDGSFPTNFLSVNNTTTTGFLNGNRTSSTVQKLFFNGAQIGTTNTNLKSSGYPPSPFYFFLGVGSYGSSTNGYWSKRECAFASIGDGLTDTEAANLYTAVQAYQTSLSRNV